MKCVPGRYSLGSMTRTSQQLSRGRARKREPTYVAGARRKNPISYRNAEAHRVRIFGAQNPIPS
jgi:hypothetical protein